MVTLEDLISEIDAIFSQVENYPNSAIGYINLYNLVVNSLENLSGKTIHIRLRKKIEGDFGDKYHVTMTHGIMQSKLKVERKTPVLGYFEGIEIVSGNFSAYQGLDYSYRYKRNAQNGSIKRWRNISLLD